MKKLLALVLCSFAFSVTAAFAQTGSITQYGNTAYDSNGNSYSTYGNTTYCSDGTSYTTYGNTTYGSDGSTASAYGNTVYYSTPDDQDDDNPYNNIYGYGYNNY